MRNSDTEFISYVEIPIRVYGECWPEEKQTWDYPGVSAGCMISDIADTEGNRLPRVIEDYIPEHHHDTLDEEVRDHVD